MIQRYLLFFAIGVVALSLIGMNAFFSVHQTEMALILRFGEPVRRGVITKPGLYFKIPLAEHVVFLDNRVLDVETAEQEVLMADNQRLVVDAFLRYRIVDPLKFYQTVRSTQRAANQLTTVLSSTLRQVLGGASVTDVVRDRRDALMQAILTTVNHDAEQIGVTVLDTRIRRADFPKEISDGVYRRMQSERQREAAEYRAQGSEVSQRIRAKADLDVTVLTAEAQQQSEIIRGSGDAERTLLFAEAYGVDMDFFSFYRTMQAYKTSFESKNTHFVLNTAGFFFKYLQGGAGVGRPASQQSQPQKAN